MLKGKIYSYFYLVALLRIILFPISILYGFITHIRNKLFDWNVNRSVSFPIPVISIGNLTSGGTGKTPHVEYLIRLLKDDFRISTLSRGYKRKSRGFVLSDENPSLDLLGDEPYLFKLKYSGIEVAVDEKRVHGVRQLLDRIPDLGLVLLDDAFQHRWIKPGLSILLTDFYNLYSGDYLLPTGNLREYRSSAKRADIIIVTKSPEVLSPLTRRRVLDSIRPLPHQSVYFSYIEHGEIKLIPGTDQEPVNDISRQTVLLVAGIANPYPLERYLKDRCTRIEKIYFPDHHVFTEKDLEGIIKTYEGIITRNKVIITTEKDMMRLIQPERLQKIRHLPFHYLPIQVRFHQGDGEAFNKQILSYVKNN